MTVILEKVRGKVLNKWKKLYNSKLVSLNKQITKQQNEIKAFNLREKYIQKIKKTIKNNKLKIYISGNIKRDYSHYIKSYEHDITKINTILGLIKISNLEELQDLNHIFDLKDNILHTCYSYNTTNPRPILERMHNFRINILSYYYTAKINIIIKIKNRTFLMDSVNYNKNHLLFALMTHENHCFLFDKLSDEQKSKLILKCFKIESNQQYTKMLLKKLSKSPKAYNTLAKMVVFT